MIKQVTKFEAMGQVFNTREEAVISLGRELLERPYCKMSATPGKTIKTILIEDFEEIAVIAEAAKILADKNSTVELKSMPKEVRRFEITKKGEILCFKGESYIKETEYIKNALEFIELLKRRFKRSLPETERFIELKVYFDL